MLFCFFIFVAIRWPLLAAFVHFIQLPLPVAIPIVMFSILFFPARGFHGPRRCTQVLHWQLALKMRNAWENGERGAEQGCKCNDEGGVGYATQSINIFFLIFPIASILFFFFYISTFYLSSWQEPTTRRLLKWNYKEVVVSSGTWKWLNEKPLEQYQSAKCALCALDFPPFCCPSGVGLLIDNIIKN